MNRSLENNIQAPRRKPRFGAFFYCVSERKIMRVFLLHLQ